MEVGSYAELYTLVIGWQLYNIVWDVLASTGIVYLPFLGILIEHWRDAFITGQDGNGAGQGVRAMEIDIYLALTVVMLAAVPTSLTPLNKTAVFFTPPASTATPTPTTANASSSGSTFDAALGGFTSNTVNVPVWWFSVIALTSGINSAIISGSTLSLDDLQKLREAGQLAKIDNPQTREELVRFYGECFVPSRTAYIRDKPNNPIISTNLSTYGSSDPEWVGSHVFRDDPAFYASMYSDREVPGWAFDATRDADLAGAATTPQWGRPNCKQWWEDSDIGLRQKLYDQANSSSKLAALIPTFATTLSAEQQTDLIVKVLVDNTSLSVVDNSYATTKDNGVLSTVGNYAKDTASTVISSVLYFLTWATNIVVRPALPFIQSFILMSIYFFLPILLILSRYSISVMILGALAIFTVKFWSVMWYVGDFFNDAFSKALYPDQYNLLSVITNPLSFFSASDASKAAVLDLVLLGLYVLVPLIFTGLMGMIGLKVGQAVSSPSQQAVNSLGSAGAIAGGLAKFGLRGAGRGISRVVGRR